MKIYFLGKYSWLRLTRSHYLKAFWGISFFVAAAVLASAPDAVSLMGKMSSVELGFKISRIAAWLSSIWIGLTILTEELNTHTARTLLTKPVSRLLSTTGILLGGMAYVTLVILATAAEVVLLAYARGIPVSPKAFLLQASVLPPLFAIMALAQLASLVFSKPVAGFLMLGLSYESLWQKLADSLQASDQSSWLKIPGTIFFRALYYIAPTYDRFVLTYSDFTRLDFPFDRFIFHSFSCMVYFLLCCVLAAFFLSRKEI